MPRPPLDRQVSHLPPAVYYKPAGVPLSALHDVTLTVDELEALRLADDQGLYQSTAADRMGVSRTTFGRILDNAHQKVARALVHGRALRIEGGTYNYQAAPSRWFCLDCRIPVAPPNNSPPSNCPTCDGQNLSPAENFTHPRGRNRHHRGRRQP